MEYAVWKQTEVYVYQMLYCTLVLHQYSQDIANYILELFNSDYVVECEQFINAQEEKSLEEIQSECRASFKAHIRRHESSIPKFKLLCNSKYQELLDMCEAYERYISKMFFTFY
jgi:hypothetical protein